MEMKWKDTPWSVLLIAANTVVATFFSMSKQVTGSFNLYMSAMNHQIGLFARVKCYSLSCFHMKGSVRSLALRCEND